MEAVNFSLWRVVKMLTATLLILILIAVLALVVTVLAREWTRNQGRVAPSGVSSNSVTGLLLPQPPPEQVIAADTRLLPEKQFWTFQFTLTAPSRVTVHVNLKGGVPAIDSYVLNEQGFNAWEAMAQTGQSATFSYFPHLSMAPLVGDYTRTGTLRPGSYTLVIDNSNMGAAKLPFHIFRHYDALIEYRLAVQQLQQGQ